MTVSEATPAKAEPPSIEYELKFVLPEGIAPAVAAWLGSACRPHPQFHDAIITSVYYDDPEWSLLGEKLNSDFLKRKLRLRWYRTPGVPLSELPAFIEGKFKAGGRREKVRVQLDTPAEAFEHTPLDAEL